MPGYEAPVYLTWAARNRSDLIRIPTYKPGHEWSTRIELRSPDPACNPYLAFSAILAASGAKAPSVIQVRTQDVLSERFQQLVLDSLRQFESALTAGALIVIDESRARARVLPLK